MLSKLVADALNDQIRHEVHSSYLYLAMAASCEAANLPGFAHWLKVQSREEYDHAMKIYEYLNDQGARVVLQAIDAPPAEYKVPHEIFKQVLEHEKKITALIHRLYGTAVKENDYATQNMLQWFVKEQVEEEKNATAIVEQLKMVGDAPAGLIMLDRYLAQRGK